MLELWIKKGVSKNSDLNIVEESVELYKTTDNFKKQQ